MRAWFDPVITAWTGVISHKLRSFLTILGIVIGVGAVITLMSVGRGSQADILSRIRNLASGALLAAAGPSPWKTRKPYRRVLLTSRHWHPPTALFCSSSWAAKTPMRRSSVLTMIT
jgi:ABC-type antimicrobial peptide transport system permease subunit